MWLAGLIDSNSFKSMGREDYCSVIAQTIVENYKLSQVKYVWTLDADKPVTYKLSDLTSALE